MKQRELSKFGKWFLNFMNNKGGAQGLVIFGLTSLAIFLGPFFVQTFNLLCSDMNFASKAIVIFGLVCVITAIVFLIKMIIFVNKKQIFLSNMGSFILDYSDNRVKEANNMLDKFKKDVKYFALKKSNIFGNDLGIYKVKRVTEQKSCLTGGKMLVIHCIGIQVNGPRYINNESEKNENTFIYGLKDFSFRITRLTESNNECVNMDGIVEMIDFFSEIDHIDETKAQKCFENFKNELTKEIDKNLM